MPYNPLTQTTAPLPSANPSAIEKLGEIPLFAILPRHPEDFLQGGFSINSASVPAAADGKKWAYAGDIFRHNPAIQLWDLISAEDANAATDNGEQVVMIPHDLDCTEQGQSSNGVLTSLHVNFGALKRPIPAYLVGPNKLFQYKRRSPIDLR